MVAHVIVKLVDEQFMGEFYFSRNPVALAQQLRRDGQYRTASECYMAKEGTEAAEEMFDVSNNPSRQAERVRIFESQRSVSVGDIVEVNGLPYLCASMGWELLA
jgi:hypothetical protein